MAPPLRADGAWSAAMILRLLHNEKYCGDLLQKKYRTVDHLTHRKVVNRGAEEQFRLENHHPAIVSRAQFAAVQAELARRAGLAGERSRFSARYWYSGKLVCGACGGRLTAKRTRRPDGREYLRFVCRGRGTGCAMRAVPGDVLTACVRHVLGEVGLPLGAMAAEVLASARPAGAECGAAALRQALRRQGGPPGQGTGRLSGRDPQPGRAGGAHCPERGGAVPAGPAAGRPGNGGGGTAGAPRRPAGLAGGRAGRGRGGAGRGGKAGHGPGRRPAG
ncbi:recombinase family protein [Flavonifractor plautii]|nr:recombinase family protein [Flavonifractor plautii]